MSGIITIGKHDPTKKAMHVKDAKNGLQCDCTCYGCEEKLEAHQGKKQVWHFQHTKESDCNGNPDKGLHSLAIEILANSKELKISPIKTIRYRIEGIEKKHGEFIPDLTAAEDDGTNWWFEVAVTHFLEEEKIKHINDLNQKCIEINLSTIPRDITVEDLKNLIFNSHDLITVYPIKKPESKSSGVAIVIGAIIFFFGFHLFRRKKKTR